MSYCRHRASRQQTHHNTLTLKPFYPHSLDESQTLPHFTQEVHPCARFGSMLLATNNAPQVFEKVRLHNIICVCFGKLCCAVICHTAPRIPCCAALHCADGVRCCAVPCHVVLYSAVPCCNGLTLVCFLYKCCKETYHLNLLITYNRHTDLHASVRSALASHNTKERRTHTVVS